MAVYRSLIRDLIEQIDRLARAHPALGQVHDIIRIATDHMAARARIEEIHQEEARK